MYKIINIAYILRKTFNEKKPNLDDSHSIEIKCASDEASNLLNSCHVNCSCKQIVCSQRVTTTLY